MSYDERLSRLVRKLSAEHNFQSPNDEAPHMRFSSVPLHWGPEICSFPSLSIVPPPLLYQQSYQDCHQFLQPYDQLDPATKPDQSQHQEYIHLMSRKEKCSQYSIPLASFNMLRRLILTFKSMLEHQIQHLIFNVMQSKHKSIMNQRKKNIDQDQKLMDEMQLLEKFANLPTTLISSLVHPTFARTNFSTMLPMEQWQEVGYENISLRLVFRAEIDVRIVPNDTTHKATLKSTGVTVGVFSNQMNRRPEELDIDINTKALYNSLRRECKVISKKVINAIVGYELLKSKPKKNSPNLMLQRHPTMMTHNKHMTMHSDGGATLRTEKTTMSSLDGRDPRSTALNVEECTRDIKTPDKNDKATLHETVYNDLTPKKRTSSMKYDHPNKTNLSVMTTGDNDLQEIEKKFAVIYEQESLDEVETKKSKKKKEHGWKRLISPHKVQRSESSSSNSTISREIIDTYDGLSEHKMTKKHEGRWKGLFTSSKQ